jgi:NAD(P)-dependent dehydrogenase (short-subunit alcohol dehydrogenase family)
VTVRVLARQLADAWQRWWRPPQLDTTDAESVARFAKWIQEKYGGVDILINNAGIAFKARA